MARANPSQTSFNAGELSPLLTGRPELERWSAGLQVCENLIPRVQGPLQRAAGTVFVSEVKDSDERCWLVPFVFSQADAFVLEFGPGYIRFFRNRGRLVDEADAIYEITTPYLAADLTRADGSFGVRFEQSGDVIYLACAGHPPQTLSRVGNLDWVLADFEPAGGPLQDQNADEAITVTATGTHTVGGTVTLSASADIFQLGHVGALMEIELEDGADIKAWQVRTDTDVDDVRRFDFNVYKCTQVGPVNTSEKPAISGENAPIHVRGKVWDGTGEEQKGDGAVGSIGAEWEYLHSGYGRVRITGFTDAQTVTAEVVLRLPEELATEATHRWALGAWSDVDGWPDNVCFFRERLTWFRGQQVWHSIAGGFDDFQAREYGEVRPDSATVVSVQSAQGNPIEWVAPLREVLLLGTNGGEHVLRSQTNQVAYGPGNTQQEPQTAVGGMGLEPIVCGAGVVFAERLGRKLRLMVREDDGFAAKDLNKAHGLLTASVVSMAWQQTPHEVVWCALANGELRGLTLQVEDQVAGWHRHDVGGAVEALAVIPSPDGGRDDVWMIVRRTIDGENRRYVEFRAAEYEAGDDAALAIYANSALTYDGAATASVSGLDHLEGETVSIKGDGATQPSQVVEDGAITLAQPASKIVVGLPASFRAKMMPLEGGAALGSSQGQTKRVHRLTARLLDSLGGRCGPEFGSTDPLQYRGHGSAMDAAPALFTGDKALPFPGGYSGRATVVIEGDGPHPFTLLSVMAELQTNEG